LLEKGVDDLLDAVDEHRKHGRVALLLSGDPCLFSLLGRIAGRFPSGDYEVVPGLSSFQLLFARLASLPGEPGAPSPSWSDVRLESIHGRPIEGVASMLHEHRRTLLFLDSKNSGPAVAAFLRDRGFPDRRVILAERVGYENERISPTTLFNLANEQDAEGLALLLVEPGPIPPLSKGVLPDSWFVRHERTPLSKEITRALTVSFLLPLDGLSVLEVGTGSGGITVELARRIAGGNVVSVERSPDALAVAEENLRRAGVFDRVRLLRGSAPEVFAELNDRSGAPLRFHRAVIGGHGGASGEIATAAWNRLLPGGRLLATANMPSSADAIYRALKSLGATPSLTHVNASSARESAGQGAEASWMLLASNPVFLIYADRNA
ncbi:MAG TPA: precorrin-6y C5,15-methyltransferase (decarboxylating) subunit CbiE, partial [Aminobacteriaceae bacterium]|nr:precorrin-6y C5,15-methyltransferase (decarboxylating) subunit CbiE [Aminobacteriaceae bacterium]